MAINLFRPEIKDPGMLRAIEVLRREKGSRFFIELDRTKLVHSLVSEEWDRLHPGMKFPDENGVIEPRE